MADYAIHDTTLVGTSNVIRKKEGSSALIDPADYPKRINLMGMLEEKTASSASVCSFSDGADDVPMSSVVAHIAPTLTGENSVSMVQTGKNLVNGYIDYNVTNKIVEPVFLKAGNYTISFQRDAVVSAIYVRKGDTVTVVGDAYLYKYNTTFFAFNADVDGYYYFQFYRSGSSTTWEDAPISNVQLEVGSAVTDYVPYKAPTTYTANLGRTVYGGQADLVSGQGIDNALWANLSDVAWTEDPNRLGVFYGAVAGRKTASSDSPSDVLGCTCYSIRNSNVTTAEDKYISGYWSYGGGSIFFRDSSMAGYTRAQVQEALAGEKVCVCSANPTSYTFDGQEIPSLLGVNNLWHDAGDTEAVYRSSGTVTPVPIAPTLVTKNITQNGTYDAEDDNADGYSSVTVAVQSAVCERLMYARCVNNDQEEIPAISNIDQGANYSSYLSYDSTTKKFTVLQNFTGVVIAWVYAYRAYDINRPDGVFYLNNTQMLSYETTGNAQGSTGGRSGIYNFKQGDTFWMYTPTRHGYPQQNCKVYRVSNLSDDIFTFADEEE